MRTLALCSLGLGLALGLSLLPGRAEEEAAAVVVFSDAAAASGTLRLYGSRPLTIAPTGSDYQRQVRLADVAAIAHRPETATLERPWTFKENGLNEKLYFEGEYPLLNFRTTIDLVDGSRLEGHLLAAVFELRDPDGGKRKVFLQRQLKGRKGQQLADLVYPVAIRFPEHQPAAARGLSGRLEGAGKLFSATAVDLEREQVVFARVAGTGFDFGPLLPGRYDLCLATDTSVLLGLGDAAPAAAAGPPLQDGDLAAARKVFPLADDFFRDRWLLTLAGNRSFAKAVVYSRRADYYEADKFTPGGWLWHLEVWRWHFAEPEWKLDKRQLLIRHRQVGGEAVRRLYLVPSLAGIEPGRELLLRRNGDEVPHDWQALRNLD